MSEQNKSIVNQAYSNFKTGNINGILDLITDDVNWTLPQMEGVPFSGTRTGRASVGEFFATLDSTQESLKLRTTRANRRRRQSRRTRQLPVARQIQLSRIRRRLRTRLHDTRRQGCGLQRIHGHRRLHRRSSESNERLRKHRPAGLRRMSDKL